jgi:O-antigen ligase
LLSIEQVETLRITIDAVTSVKMLTRFSNRLNFTHKLDSIKWLQWLAVGTVAAMLGLYTLLVVMLQSEWVPLLLLAAAFPFLILLIGNLKKILISIIVLDIPLQIDVALNSYSIFNTGGVINGYIISITTISLALLYSLWIFEYLVKRDQIQQHFKWPNKFLTLYLAITCLSMVLGYLQVLASYEIFLLVQMFLLYFYLINKIHSIESLHFIVIMLLVGLLMESLIIILMQIIGYGFNFAGMMGNIYAESTTPGGFSRIGGTLISANSAGSYISLLLVPAFSIIMTNLKSLYKWLAILALISGMVALIMTGSRGAWLATFISFIVFGIVSYRRGWLELKILGIGASIVLLISPVFFTYIYERVYGYDFGAAAGRIPQYQVALQIIKDHPVFGVGANNYPVILQRYLHRGLNSNVFQWAVHNKYLLVWAETGIFGLLFFILFLVSTLHQGLKITRINNDFLPSLALGFTAAIAGHMVHMFFDVFHGRPQVQLLWCIAGLICIMSLIIKRKPTAKVNTDVH